MKSNITIIYVILPIITLLGGWILGLLSSFMLERIRREQAIQAKLFDQYLKVREEIAAAISLIIGKTRPQCNDILRVVASEHVEDISRLFFTHYDLLPHEVAIEMVCLYCCLLKDSKHVYRCDNRNRIVPLDLSNDFAVSEFIRGITIVNNLMLYAPSAFRSKNKDTKRDAIIRCQAFSVLAELNKYFGKKKLMSWGKFLRKPPIAEKDNYEISRTTQCT